MKKLSISNCACAALVLALGSTAAQTGVAADAPSSTDISNQCLVFINFESARLPDLLKRCDAAIAAGKHKSFHYYNRGLARYWQIRGEGVPLSQSIANAASASGPELHKAMADLQVFITDDPVAGMEDMENAHMRLAELIAVNAAREKSPAGYELALKHIAQAETSAKKYEIPENFIFKAIAEARAGIYKAYGEIYGASEAAYRNDGQAFQALMKAEQAAPSQDHAALCKSLGTMNSSFQNLKSAFSNISNMKDRGEMGADPAMVAKIDGKKAQLVQVQGTIDATATRFACKPAG